MANIRQQTLCKTILLKPSAKLMHKARDDSKNR
jgi:hypothetical protein